ncbi:DUF4097 family beta strand repeat-containing protein [Goodfellowiella coeruleoviolacea]|uniref:DUF4097 and DUF4098 domain-containing protein YvlB n=1 Tax=Goodfellowiella coeruleoviolacea TaxID=334858 RepID=A0AAE3GPK3_9PSEU|nr:DUF4097 family beta strand repeat-containing protein [Goodfellowiella coeruleoviolacea]MCP2169828.1 DUF4097 and DUF4098 domain-containing protein YvlB [Goodfellowiella coeruleoviolacea]
MSTFDTPAPIDVRLDAGVVNIRITASDRTNTVVELRPTDEDDESDVKAAQQSRAEYANGTLLIRTPRPRAFDFSKKTRSVEVFIELPTGSQLHGDASVGNLHCTGRLGEVRFKTSMGNFAFDRTGPLHATTGIGHVSVDRADGNAEISTGTGQVHLGQVDGTANVKNSSGNVEIDAVTGDARLRLAAGEITIGQAGAGIDAKTAMGAVRVGAVARGSVELKTAMGDIEVGVVEGTAAWLDVHTSFGKVRNGLTETGQQPGPAEQTVEIRANTSCGDVVIRRA